MTIAGQAEDHVKQARVLIANMPPILGQILTGLVNAQPDMSVVGEVRSLAGLPPAIASLRAAAVILTLPRPSVGRAMCRAIRRHHPAITLLGQVPGMDRIVVLPAGGAASCIAMSASGIVRALRGQGAQRRGSPAAVTRARW
jgi:DNA-binding NarL/FixJ family response regulator